MNDSTLFGESDARPPTDAREQITSGASKSWFSRSDLDSYSMTEGSNAEDDMLYWSVLDRRDFTDRFGGCIADQNSQLTAIATHSDTHFCHLGR
jgi:hypothetical protein